MHTCLHGSTNPPEYHDAGVTMNNGRASASALRSPKDALASASLLSKASASFRRSPSKKHTYKSSKPVPNLDGVLFDTKSNPPAASSRPSTATSYRPGVGRNPSAPVTVHTVKDAINANEDDMLPPTMIVAPFGNALGKENKLAHSMTAPAMPRRNDSLPFSINVPPQAKSQPLPAQWSVPGPMVQPNGGPLNPASIYQHIREMASKRISTLDYMRKAHDGRVYWFNTVHFSRSELSRLPSYTPSRLTRKASSYLMLGLSVPAVLDVHPKSASNSATTVHEFLRSLNALLGEFESFQQLHPSDGSTVSSMSRARIPQMFKRAATATTGKGRRSSNATATEIGLPMHSTSSTPSIANGTGTDPHPSHATTASIDTSISSNSTIDAPASAISISSLAPSFPSAYSSVPTSSPHDAHPNNILLPNEGPYTHLLTPPLPFAPDFYVVFATLCDVLIDAYQRILHMVNSPQVCTVAVADSFYKADSRLRKVIVGGVIKEFEGAARESGKRELMGVQKVVLGGLMGG